MAFCGKEFVMRSPRFSAFALCALFAFITAIPARGDWIPTNVGTGADAEVRDHTPTTNFGASTELGVRIQNIFPAGHASDGTDRWSVIYTRFDLTGQTIPADFVAAFRLTVRNTNLTPNRLQDTGTPDLSYRVGLHVFGLHPTVPAWNEATITYNSAPGLAPDTNSIGNKDLNLAPVTPPAVTPLAFLGTMMFPALGVQNRLPVGGSLVLRSAALNNFISSALAGGATQVTLVTVLAHGGEGGVNDIRNFNYLFNPKEQTTLTVDTGYDADITNPSNPLGSPHSGASNATGAYSPAIRFDPPTLPSLSLINVETDRVDLQIAPTVDGFPFNLEFSHELFASIWTRIATVNGSITPVTFSVERLPGDTRNFYRLTR